MSPDFQDVLAFHRKYGQPCGIRPQLLSVEAFQFRHKFLHEELKEFRDAQHLVAQLDGLMDLVYVAIGTALFVGCPQDGLRNSWPLFHNQVDMVQPIRALPVIPTRLSDYEIDYHATGIEACIYQFELASNTNTASLDSILPLKRLVASAYQAAVQMSCPWSLCWSHVQRANMKKVRAASDGSDSTRKSSMDVVKPSGWIAPDAEIARTLSRSGWEIPSHLAMNLDTGKIIDSRFV